MTSSIFLMVVAVVAALPLTIGLIADQFTGNK